jgi:all-trans-retinol 13,14-reductase
MSDVVTHSVGTPYKRFRDDRPFDAIVIGSGIGGLGTAALLAKSANRRVLVLEQHYSAGGLTHAFRRPGFEWDVGLHYVGQIQDPDSAPRRLFDYLTEGRLSWKAMPNAYDRVRIGDLRFDYVRGQQLLRDALVGSFPRERRAIDRYFNAVARCIARVPFFFVEKLLPPVPARVIGSALRMPFMRLARRTTADVLEDIGVSVELKAVLTAQWGDYGLPPRRSSFGAHALITSHYFEGAAYPIGGGERIAAALLPTIEQAGGQLVVGARVERVLVENGRTIGVRMEDGRELRSTCVVSDAGIRTTYEQLLPDAASEVAEPVLAVRALRPSLGHLCLYVGLESTPRQNLSAANLWLHPSVDFDGNLDRFVADIDAPFPYLFISSPSAKDPSFAARYPGHHTIEVLTLAPYERFAAWRGTAWHHRGPEYQAVKDRLARRMLDALEEHMPGVSASIRTWELSTPLSTEHFTAAFGGAAYGLAHGPERFACQHLRPRTPIEGLYLTGQDVSTCGIMGALSGAVTAASTILRRNLFSLMQHASRVSDVTDERRVA